MDLFIKQTHRQIKVYGYQREEQGWEINQQFGINIYTLLQMSQKSNKDPLFSTGNHIQHLVTTYNEKESEKLLSHFAVYLKLKICCKSMILHFKNCLKKNDLKIFVISSWQSLLYTVNSRSQEEKNKYHMLMHTCRIQKNGTDEFISKAEQRNRHREWIYGYREKRGGWDGLGYWK